MTAIVITGGTDGMGRALARTYLDRGDTATAAHVAALKRYGAPVAEGIKPIIARVDAPPAEPLSAFLPDARISLDNPSFAPGDAARLDDLTRHLLRPREN
ncbi:Rossmann-fold NAD(P)-binding domain-containing protein [Microtetraspora malaysiensis]|uniref:Short chain dehydrogenase n=1 Tax=Microtetraspora malaysiensis TaxID=161358 RepID=A0ABW6T2U6_9ACTN